MSTSGGESECADEAVQCLTFSVGSIGPGEWWGGEVQSGVWEFVHCELVGQTQWW